MNAIENAISVPPKLSWLKRIIRYGLHLLILYQVVSFSTTALPDLIYNATLSPAHRTGPSLPQAAEFLISHLLAFSVIPAFVVGLLINARFRHKAAEYIWIVPVVILAYEFIFHGPGIYPTMLGDSDFPKAFHFFFGGGLPTDATNWRSDWYRVYTQVRFTVPAYGALAYSFGAFLGMNPRSRAFQTFMERF
jgi:hypothetical protein